VTSIEWTDKTWNPTDGCEVCSPGCANCYAMRFAGRFSKPKERYHGLVTIAKNKRAIWTGEGRLDVGKLAKPMGWKKPARIFVNSMSDLFFEKFTNEEIAAVFGVMAACPQHTFQILTKRAARMREWFTWAREHFTEWQRGIAAAPNTARAMLDAAAEYLGTKHDGLNAAWARLENDSWPLANVWLCVSVENQDAANERIPHLLATPAVVRGLSCEPLIGAVDCTLHGAHIKDWDEDWHYDTLRGAEWGGRWREEEDPPADSARLDWVIAGCESGPGARPCDVAWLRSLRDQCEATGTAFFLKQAMELRGPDERSGDAHRIAPGRESKRKGKSLIALPYLDGELHAAFPTGGSR
jgi:protein gp37